MFIMKAKTAACLAITHTVHIYTNYAHYSTQAHWYPHITIAIIVVTFITTILLFFIVTISIKAYPRNVKNINI